MNARVDTLLQQAITLAPPEQAELLDALFELVSPSTPEWEKRLARRVRKPNACH